MSSITTKDGTRDLLQGLGNRAAGRVQPRLAAQRRRLGRPDGVPRVARGYRCIAHDRRGHGRSSQPWDGNDMDTYADDLAALVETLDLSDAIHVGHSTGGGEVARYIGRHGTTGPSGGAPGAVLIGAVPPLMLQTPANPGGLPIDGVRRDPRRRARRPLAVLQGPAGALLRLQPPERQGLRGLARLVLAAGHAWPASRRSSTASRRSRRPTSRKT